MKNLKLPTFYFEQIETRLNTIKSVSVNNSLEL